MPVFEKIATFGVVPVITIHDASHALPLADALIAGGLPVAEVTFRSQAAPEAIRLIAAHRSEMQIGAGTILTERQADEALAAGASFALSPGIDRKVVDHAASIGLPFAPGIMTPSDLQIALRAGCQMVKFFPATSAGGPAMLQSIAAPYLHTGIAFNPTGGVTLENMKDWLALPFVKAIGGTWIATAADIAAGNWSRIAKNARLAAKLAYSLRAKE